MRVIANLVSSIIKISQVAAIAQWFHLCLPYCGPRFESQAHHAFFNMYYCNCIKKIRKINKKRPGLAHFLKTHQQSQQKDLRRWRHQLATHAAPLTSIHRKPSCEVFFPFAFFSFPRSTFFWFLSQLLFMPKRPKAFLCCFFLVLFLFSFAYRIGDVSFIFVSNGLQHFLSPTSFFFKWALNGLFFFIFVFSIQMTVNG